MEKQSLMNPEPIGVGYFGKIYDQFKGKVKEAFYFLVAQQSGDLLGVFHDDEIGDIDLVWGSREENAGLDHIIFKHVGEGKDFMSLEEVQTIIEKVIDKGVKIKVRWDKLTFDLDGLRVVVRKNVRDGNGNIVITKKNWVVTSFDNNKPKSRKIASAITLATPDNTPGGRAVASDAVS
jgi:hypothetical protein